MNWITQAFLSLIGKDTETYPQAQATGSSKNTKFVRLSVYGVESNPPQGCHVLLLSSEGQEEVKFGISNDFINRIKNLKEGETALHNSKTGTLVLLKNDGTIEITGASDVNIDGNLSATGSISAGGAISADGNISSGGNISASGDVTAGTISLKNHIHTQANDSGGDVEGPTSTPI